MALMNIANDKELTPELNKSALIHLRDILLKQKNLRAKKQISRF